MDVFASFKSKSPTNLSNEPVNLKDREAICLDEFNQFQGNLNNQVKSPAFAGMNNAKNFKSPQEAINEQELEDHEANK